MNLYPVMINMAGKTVAVIGGGRVALRKVRDLLEAGAIVRVVAPEIHEEISGLAGDYGERLEFIEREYKRGDLDGSVLVFSTTGDSAVNRAVYEDARESNILINAADDPPNCSFYIPSFTRRADLILSLSTSGASPAMAARLRRELEKHIPENIEEILSALREAREKLRTEKGFAALNTGERGELLQRIVNDGKLLERACSSFSSGRLREFLMELI